MTEQLLTPDIMDFSTTRPKIQFRVDGDVFEAPPEIPAQTMADFAKQFNDVAETTDISVQMDMFSSMLRMILYNDSAQRFIQRMGDKDNPIGLDQADRIITWLMEQYGMRPTLPSEDSSPTPPSPASGTSSTDGPSDVASVSSILQPQTS